MEKWRSQDGSEIAVVAATWELNPRITFESLADEFRRNPMKAWRNFGSVVNRSIEGALKDPDVVNRHINRTRESPWNFGANRFEPWFRGKSGKRHFMHFDLSKNRDATGLSMVHHELPDSIEVDFMLRVEAQAGGDIKYADLREKFIYPLISAGFAIECISFDGFQSEETRQVLEERGIATDYCSADKNTEPYDTLIDLLHTQRLDYYNYPPFIRELEHLQFNGTKYDHPRRFRNSARGSKDVADAVACAAFMALRYVRENPVEAPGILHVRRSSQYGAPRGLFGQRSEWD